VKSGFDQGQFLGALNEPKPFFDGSNTWNIVAVETLPFENTSFIFGKLSKIKPDATVKVMTQNYSKEIEKDEPDMVISSSEFVYIPDYSGIAFHSIPNHIEPKKFVQIFTRIIEDSLGAFFVQCELNLIDDLTSFLKKLDSIQEINRIKISVNPPNPLYGKFWKSLKEYLEGRNAEELTMVESSKKKNLRTRIKELLALLVEGNEEKIDEYIKQNQSSLLDLGILMSLDGYGSGRIDGTTNGKHEFVKTHEKILHFSLPPDPEAEDIFQAAEKVLRRISDERYMGH
jgi:hypothetical protein